MAKVVAFANQKGGVAKTTTTLNLGVAVQETGPRVLVVDLDPQGNLTMSLGLDPDAVRPSMYDVLAGGTSIEETIAHAEVDLAVASIDLAAVEIALSSLIGRERALSKALYQVRGQLRLHLHRHAALVWACSPSTPSPRRTRSWSRCSASICRLRGLEQLPAPWNWCGRT